MFQALLTTFNTASRSWSILQTKGGLIPGIFGHSSVLVASYKKQDYVRITKRWPFVVKTDEEEEEEEDARVFVLGGV